MQPDPRVLDRLIQTVVTSVRPLRIILFGSAATGKVGPYSDIDLVVIKKTSLPYFERISQLVDLLDYDIGVDFLVYSPEEFDRAVRERRFFREEIIKKGKVLYEKAA